MPSNNSRSTTRTQQREVEKKFIPAVKTIANHLHNTGRITDDFAGYKTFAGGYTDPMGREWQIHAVAVCQKKDFIKKDVVIPMITKGKFKIWLKGFIKHVIDTIYK
ncbi:MAG: hypothetical protein LLF95_11290 [Bacteroidales bacterium]|nr:hypothetical protein [Bacteroidales bacterium]